MSKKQTKTEGTTILKLHELPFESIIEIGGHEYQFKGYEKRKTNFGNVEHFVFKTIPDKNGKVLEKIIERFNNATIKIKKKDEKYYW